jgi:hypothetical protein
MHAGFPVAPVLPARRARAISTLAGLLARDAGTFPNGKVLPLAAFSPQDGNGALARGSPLTVAGAAAAWVSPSAFPFQPLRATGVWGAA